MVVSGKLFDARRPIDIGEVADAAADHRVAYIFGDLAGREAGCAQQPLVAAVGQEGLALVGAGAADRAGADGGIDAFVFHASSTSRRELSEC